MIETSAIDAWLAATLREVRAARTAAWPQAAGTSSEELRAIWSRIEYHGIPLLLNDHSALLDGWPDKMLARIAEEARLVSLWEATHAECVSRLLTALDAAGVETVLMKGTAMAYSLYDEPAIRRRGDSDLLIRPGNLEKARAVLSECGWYRNEDPHGLVYQEGWLHDVAGHFIHALDLHWKPSDRPVLERVIPLEDFFARKQPLPRLCGEAHRADHALTLIHETLNQKWHESHGYWAEEGRIKGSRRLIWSIDIDLVAASFSPSDWERLGDLCTSRGIGPLVADALKGARSDLGTELPANVLSRLGTSALDPDIAAYFETTDSLAEFWLDLRTARSWRERLRMIGDRALPPRAHLIEKYPQGSRWPTALLRARLLAETSGRVLRRAVQR